MTDKQLKTLKNKLEKQQKEIMQSILDEYEDEENPFEVDGDLADRAEAFSAINISEELTSSQKDTLEKIQRALRKIKDGNYGTCKVCGKDIEFARLKAVPWATTCKEHMSQKRYHR